MSMGLGLGLGLGARGVTVRAPDYYVNSATGSDINGGTTAATAYASLAPLAALAAGTLTGKTIGLACGLSYAPLDLAVITADNLTITSYGSGAKPYFDCTAAIAGPWTETSLGSGIWYVDLPRSANVKMFGNYFRNGVPMRKVPTLAALTGTGANTCFAANEQTTTVRLNMNSVADPGSDGAAYRYSRYGWAVATTGSNNRMVGLWARGSAHQDGMFVVASPSSGALAGNYLGYCRLDYGSRHSALVGSGAGTSIAEGNAFNGARNDVETGQALSPSANALVFNSADHTASICISRGNTYDGMGLASYVAGSTAVAVRAIFTGPYGHDGVAGRAMTKFISQNDTFIDCYFGAGAPGQDNEITGGVHTRTVQGFVVNATSNPTILWSGNTGTIDQLVYVTNTTIIVTDSDNNIVSNNVGAGTGMFIRIPNTVGSPVTWTSRRNTYTLNDVAATSIANARFFYADYGTLDYGAVGNGNTIAPALCDALLYMFFGSNLTVTANGNTYPAWFAASVGGSTYNSLTEWQAAGKDASASNAAPPAATLSDSFAGASGNLDARWTRQTGTTNAGAANAMTLGDGVVNATSAALTAYVLGDTATADQYVSFVVKGVNATAAAGPGLHIVNNDDACWARWNATTYQIAQAVSGTVSQMSSGAATPAANDACLMVARAATDPTTAAVTQVLSLIVNGKRVIRFNGALPTFAAEKSVGAVNRITAQAPLFGPVSYGPAR